MNQTRSKKQIITEMYDHVKALIVALHLWMKQLGEENFAQFSTLKSLREVEA